MPSTPEQQISLAEAEEKNVSVTVDLPTENEPSASTTFTCETKENQEEPGEEDKEQQTASSTFTKENEEQLDNETAISQKQIEAADNSTTSSSASAPLDPAQSEMLAVR